MDTKFSLNFFRKYFRIPKDVVLNWCILEEHGEYGNTERLGVMLLGTNKVIDVSARCFVQTGLVTLPVSYQAYPATRKWQKDVNGFEQYSFVTATGKRIRVSPTYVSDIYFRCIYSEELMYQLLI